MPRLTDSYINELNQSFPALAIDGPKAVGKTSSAMLFAKTVLEMDNERILESVINNPDQLIDATKPVLLDEWQYYPQIWNRVRRLVDDGAQPGSYLLTGSAYPVGAQIHSGAGRIIHMRMRPLSLQERRLAKPTVSLADCLDGTLGDVAGTTELVTSDYLQEVVRSGYPAIWASPEKNRPRLIDSYIDNIVHKELHENGYTLRRPDSLRRWLRAYAAATGTSASYTSILDVATPGEGDKLSRSTMESYRNMLSSLWLLDEVPAWDPIEDSFSRLKQAPKHFLADPALAARLLSLDARTLGMGGEETRFDAAYGTLVGRLFEALVSLSLKSYALVNDAEIGYLRSRNGDREIDFIISRGRRIVAIEVKLAPTIEDSDLRHLKWLKEQYGKNLMECIIVTTGISSYRRPDGILVVPAALLGA